MTNEPGTTPLNPRRWIAAALVALATAAPVAAQTAPAAPSGAETATNATPAAPAAQEDDPDRDVNFAQPDFTLAALPTTLRVPRHKSSFRVTHRFGRALGAGDFGDLVGDLFGLDGGALIGLEYRFGLFRATQVGFHRTSNKTIEFFVQRQLFAQSDTFPFAVDVLATVDGTNNFRDSYSPALGVLVSRELGERAALYFEPIWVNNSNALPAELADDNSTFMIGLGARLRIRPSVYLLVEGAPRIAGFRPGVDHASFGIEKRMGGHLFQLNVSNGHGTTMGQLARGGPEAVDWFLGFTISRKFF